MGNGQPSLGQRVFTWARNRLGQQVGDGECFALADSALRAVGAHSAAHYGTVTADADYRWGNAVELVQIQPGDILQFRDYSVTITVVVRTVRSFRDGSTEESENETTETYERPHHTAIVAARLANGRVRVLAQNAPPRGGTTPERLVRENEIHTTSSTATQSQVLQESGATVRQSTTTTISVSGTIRAYRPQPR